MTVNFSNDLKVLANYWLSAMNFKSFSRLLEQFFLTEQFWEQNTIEK